MVLLRRALSSHWDEIWGAWDEETREQFCNQLLKSAAEEKTPLLRKRLADVIAEVARYTLGNITGSFYFFYCLLFALIWFLFQMLIMEGRRGRVFCSF